MDTNNFLAFESGYFDQQNSMSAISLIEACSNFMEQCDDFYVTEKQKDSIVLKLKKFIAEMISNLQNLKNAIVIKVEGKVREATFQKKLKDMREELKTKKSEGVRKIEMIDVESLSNEYYNLVFDLENTMKRISKMKYHSIEKLDKDIDDFHKTVDKYQKSLDDLANTKVKYPINKVINFVDQELTGSGNVIKSMNESINTFKQMEADVSLIETREKILGAEIITKHVGFIRRMCNRFNAFVKKWVVKIITTVVFLFA